MFDHILNWKLKSGSHGFPGPDGGTCINEAAIVAAGFEYRSIRTAWDMPPCFSRVICHFALKLNDGMPDDERDGLLPFVARLAGTAGSPDVERQRAIFLADAAIAFSDRNIAGPRAIQINACAEESRRLAAWKFANAGGSFIHAEESAAVLLIRAAEIASVAFLHGRGWDAALAALDGALAVGPRADPVDVGLIKSRMDEAKARALVGAS